MLLIALKGFTISFSLICAIGAQNAHILKQGLLKNHIFWICTTCLVCDVMLIWLGIFGVGKIISENKLLLIALTLLGVLFLSYYGYLSCRAALSGQSAIHLKTNRNDKTTLVKALSTTLAITLLNPHVYLDTVVIIGSVSGTLASFQQKIVFMIGGVVASSIWFYALGYGSQKLSHYFSQPRLWQWLDLAIAFIMWSIAVTLLIFAINHWLEY